jgi:hypothetical protein
VSELERVCELERVSEVERGDWVGASELERAVAAIVLERPSE